MDHDYRVTGLVIGCAIEVHKALGPGLKEDSYHKALCAALSAEKIAYRSNNSLPVLSYMKVAGMRVGLILNFNCSRMANGIKRIVL